MIKYIYLFYKPLLLRISLGRYLIFIVIFLLFVNFINYGCVTAINKNNKVLKVSKSENISKFLKRIDEINQNSAKSFYAEFSIEGFSESNKFKSTGMVQFHKNPKKLRITFHDAIFKSPITIIVQDAEIIKIYFPVDNTLYIDKANSISLKNYSNINLDFVLISDLISGKIPMISNYSVKQGLEEIDNKNKLLIIENVLYYETISFKNNLPDKILWLNKKNKEKIEVYFSKPIFNNKSLFYKNIRMISMSSNLKINIEFNNIKFNNISDFNKYVKINLSRGTKIIYVK